MITLPARHRAIHMSVDPRERKAINMARDGALQPIALAGLAGLDPADEEIAVWRKCYKRIPGPIRATCVAWKGNPAGIAVFDNHQIVRPVLAQLDGVFASVWRRDARFCCVGHPASSSTGIEERAFNVLLMRLGVTGHAEAAQRGQLEDRTGIQQLLIVVFRVYQERVFEGIDVQQFGCSEHGHDSLLLSSFPASNYQLPNDSRRERLPG
jgi:hypothetical protein